MHTRALHSVRQRSIRGAVQRSLGLESCGSSRRLLIPVALAVALVAEASPAQEPYRQRQIPGTALDAGGNSQTSLVDLDGDGYLDALVGRYNGFSLDNSILYLEGYGDSSNGPRLSQIFRPLPSPELDLDWLGAPTFVDLDADGDLDAIGVVDGVDRALKWFENTGSSSAPSFVEVAPNPFELVPSPFGTPSLADVDGDDDLDLYFDDDYYENTGDATTPAFLEGTGSSNPFDAIPTHFETETLVDLDQDGDTDLVVGLRFFDNTGSATMPVFFERSGTFNPFAELPDRSSNIQVDFGDLDGDGDLDALSGNYHGTVDFWENTGTTWPQFVLRTNWFGFGSSPAVADLDGDGDDDIVLSGGGSLQLLLNSGSAGHPAFQVASSNPFAPFQGFHPMLGDMDADGDFDCIFALGSRLTYLENVGNSSQPTFIEQTSSIVSGINVGTFDLAPALADLDDDQDLDLVLGSEYGQLSYWENMGSASQASFVEISGFFGLFDFGFYSRPALADLDDDGDLDVAVGGGSHFIYGLQFLENTGTPNSPSFRTDMSFFSEWFPVGPETAAALVDLDDDGDIDILVGEEGGHLVFFESVAPLFADGFETGDTSAW
ncbi:MAG: FG-GAP-like repeat-containing protein [Thermoanaerobaculia bacterium]|nr:FG-GAP-like repeat-containing protein [Thermoanaerobaculia bacterium]